MVKNANRSGGIIRGGTSKASVVDEAGHLYIAKFPSVKDEYDVGGWEMVVNALAVGCGLNVAPAQAHNLPAITIVLWFVVLTALMREGVCILLRL